MLFPPNVKGWDGGLSWITTNNLLNRYNYAAYLVVGQDLLNPRQRPRGRPSRNSPGNSPVEVGRLFGEEVRKNRKLLASAIQKRLLHAELKPEHQSAVRAYLDSQGELDDLDVLHAIRLVMCTPEFQLT